ncbi:2-keto-3-deoxy-galactonokinase [Salipiger aestuarii]|uniref:2-dehydro-3-deoxygalactonokinase n=1 Tax=Salipiger aestuarii TaxID=568098 RepID=A0A327Y755_9RHOB|nr:2-dehydro-3-deoxygalactonokinase [Salipiger aestuarii]EIE50621.1 2-dehydro-3-deoxygalactonokinase [Citreicella sp. 357]KAA8607752.1 2-keto-3-deoxy-galactonokinase [Salipiger aestuarii]KAB2542017.1 2-keto-3-deoxy-galactonokinase [Salipiger aestuarii]RAK15585.1 2-dehydro-3-deoxygalactonokinase [Salipiger aestuarii]
MTDDTPALIALDWGTSSLRAFAMTAQGRVIDTRASGHGVQHLPEPGLPGFEAAFAAICGTWLDRAPLPVVASGMVGSAQGWREVPYLPCPADLGALPHAAGRVTTAGGQDILIAPGLIHDPAGAPPDVMRGEEIQIAGAIAGHPDRQAGTTLILPGTHSKWARVEGGTVTGFETHMTGELFALLRTRSILGRLMSDAPLADTVRHAAFLDGVAEAARDGAGGLTHLLFGTRTLGLTGRLPAAALAEYCSGLLIGHEIVSALATRADGPLLLVGSPALCARYDRALTAIAGRGAEAIVENPAPAGLFRLACDAGLLTSESGDPI